MAKSRTVVLGDNMFEVQEIPNMKIIEKCSSKNSDHDVKLWIPKVMSRDFIQNSLQEEEAVQNGLNKVSSERERIYFLRLKCIEPLEEVKETKEKIISLNNTSGILRETLRPDSPTFSAAAQGSSENASY